MKNKPLYALVGAACLSPRLASAQALPSANQAFLQALAAAPLAAVALAPAAPPPASPARALLPQAGAAASAASTWAALVAKAQAKESKVLMLTYQDGSMTVTRTLGLSTDKGTGRAVVELIDRSYATTLGSYSEDTDTYVASADDGSLLRGDYSVRSSDSFSGPGGRPLFPSSSSGALDVSNPNIQRNFAALKAYWLQNGGNAQ